MESRPGLLSPQFALASAPGFSLNGLGWKTASCLLMNGCQRCHRALLPWGYPPGWCMMSCLALTPPVRRETVAIISWLVPSLEGRSSAKSSPWHRGARCLHRRAKRNVITPVASPSAPSSSRLPLRGGFSLRCNPTLLITSL